MVASPTFVDAESEGTELSEAIRPNPMTAEATTTGMMQEICFMFGSEGRVSGKYWRFGRNS
jgi:hypothetical protein